MYPQTRGARLCLALAALSAAACTAEKRSTSPILTGSMRVTMTSTQGVKPAVTVTGPNGCNRMITSTQTLSELPIDDYGVAADSVVQPDPVVGTLVDSVGIKGNPAAIQTGDTSKVSVTYALKSRTGALWVADNATGVIPEYAAAQLDAAGPNAGRKPVDARGRRRGARVRLEGKPVGVSTSPKAQPRCTCTGVPPSPATARPSPIPS